MEHAHLPGQQYRLPSGQPYGYPPNRQTHRPITYQPPAGNPYDLPRSHACICQHDQQAHGHQQHGRPAPSRSPNVFPSRLTVNLTIDSRGNLMFNIGQEYYATIHLGFTTDKLSVFSTGPGPSQPLVEVESTGMSGTKADARWQGGQTDRLNTRDLVSMSFQVDGQVHKWVETDKREASHALGFESKKALKLVAGDNKRGQALAYWGEAKGFHYTKGTGQHAAVVHLDGRVGDVAVAAVLKLWQLRAAKKLGGAISV
ncbi:uncharacterized protein F5Z01DRAFT_632541 [Emericellopsis atlantica]|uniref:Uncharacterized protein n=1 Tax=Emericellopsis atlantica TaxID=2614577 RepID=A0A9P8CT49_9HYPO|nr:uncharacterized protein F5Z01DRAFT_632541 [Emericellopsis atlantica]KAG9258463.1 hypothetical protein F5Z01DRAFT_632541 [Emericellopsis atlantica]